MQPSALFQASCIFVIIFSTTSKVEGVCSVEFNTNEQGTLTCVDSVFNNPVMICQSQAPVTPNTMITKQNEGNYSCCCGNSCQSNCAEKVFYGEQTKDGSVSNSLEVKWGDSFNIPCAYTPGELINEDNADDFYKLKWDFAPKFMDGSKTLFPQAGNAQQVHKFSLDKNANTISVGVFNPLKDQGIYTCTVELKQNGSSSSSFIINVIEATDSSISSTSIMSPPISQITSIEDGRAQFNCGVRVPSYKTIGFSITNRIDNSLNQQIVANITDNSCTLEGNHTVMITCASNGPTSLKLSCSYDTPYQINCSLVMSNVTNKNILTISCFVVEDPELVSESVLLAILSLPVVSVVSSTIIFIAGSLEMPTIKCTIVSSTTPNVTWTVNDPLVVSLQQPELMEGSVDGVYSSTLTVNRDIMLFSDKVFTCTATNVNGSSNDSHWIEVVVIPPVVTIVDDSKTLGFVPLPFVAVASSPFTFIAASHQMSTIKCTIVSSTTPNVTWTVNDPLVSLQQPELIPWNIDRFYNSTLTVNRDIMGSTDKVFTCTATNVNGSDYDSQWISISVGPPDVTIVDDSITIGFGDPLVLTCTANSAINTILTWYHPMDQPLTHINTFDGAFMYNSTIRISAVTVTDRGVYTCEGSNLIGFKKDIVQVDITVTDTSKRIQLQPGSIAGIAIAGSVVIMFGLICCVTIPCLLERKRKLKSIESPLHVSNFEMEDQKDLKIRTNAQLNKLNLLSCVIDPSDLKLMEKVGQGEFGIVYRGILRNDSSIISVAIKTVRGLCSDSLLADELFVEAEKMKSFDHLHVLSLTGVCVGLLESPCIVMPFMSHGSLLSYLRRESADLTINEIVDENLFNSVHKHLLSICLQVAKGMDYLSQQKFVHRDLAARNCMLSSEGIIKIADFGLAEDVYTTEYFKQVRSSDDTESVKLPLKWMALESIHLGKFDEKTDVWSYGVLCWEVFNGGNTPYPGSTPREVVAMLDNGERLTKPKNAACTEEVFSVLLSSWEKSPKCRPHFFELVENINKLLVPLADYLDLAPDFKTIG